MLCAMHDGTAHERLRQVRKRRFPEASAAARAMNVPVQTYIAHENGSRPMKRAVDRYAAFFRVSIDWLLTGRGTMKGGQPRIPLMGLIGAGATIFPMTEDTAGDEILDHIELPDEGHCAALQIRGDSQYPRFLDGEIVVYDTRPVPPGQLINRYAVVDLTDGRRLLKTLRRMPTPGSYRLESHNAPPEDDVDISATYPLLMLLPR